tara:strand:- start:262 stop:3747 length:3486 start_codon:yes stop_codon:yes gene_type:complete
MADYNLLTFDALKSNSPPVLDLSTNTIGGESLLTFDKLRGFSSTGETSQSAYSSDYANSFGNIIDIAEDNVRAEINKSIGLVLDIVGFDDTASEYRADAKRIEKEAAAKPQPTLSASITEEAPKIYDKLSEGDILSAMDDSLQLGKSFVGTILPSLGISTIGAVGALAATTVGIPAALATGIGILVPSYLMSSGGIYEGALKQGASEKGAAAAGVLGGSVSAAIDRIGIGFWFNGIVKKLGRKGAIDSIANISGASKKIAAEAVDEAAKSTTESTIKKSLKGFGRGVAASAATKEVISETGKGFVKGAIGEGVAETGQAATEILATNIAGDNPLSAVISADSGKKIIDSLALGIVGGGVIAGPLQGVTAPIKKEAQRKAIEIEQLNNRMAKATTDYEKELILGERTALTEGRQFKTGLEQEMPGVDLGPKFAELGKLQEERDSIEKVKGSNDFSTKRKKVKLRKEFNDSPKGEKLKELKKELKFKSEGIGSSLKKIITRSTTALEGFANRTPIAREVINDLNNVINNTNQSTGSFAKIKTILLDPLRKGKKLPFQKSIDKDINKELYNELTTEESSTNLKIREAANQIRKQILDPIYLRFKEAGSDLGFIDNYLPVIVKPFGRGPKGKKNKEDFIALFKEQGLDGEAYIERALENDGLYKPDNSFAEIAIEKSTESKASTIGVELERSLPRDLVDKLGAKDLLETDVEKLLNKYIVQSMRNIEVKNFANKHNPNIQEFLNSGLMESSEANHIKKIVDGLQNNFNNIKNKNFRKAYKFLLTGTYIATLGLAAIPSLVEPMVVLTKVSPKNALFGAFKALNVSRRKGIRAFKPKFPRNKDELALMTLMQTSDMALNDSIRDLGDTVYSKRITDKFFKINLLAQVTQFSRNIAFQAGRLQIRDDIKRLEVERDTQDVSIDTTNARERLIQLGLINPISRSDTPTESQVAISNWANSVETNNVLPEPEIITKALGKLVNEVIMTPDVLNKPLWMADPRLAPVAQLKSFGTVFGNTIGMKVYKDIFIPLQQGRIPAANIMNNAIFFTLLLTAIMGTQALKDALKYGDKESPTDKLEGWEKIWHAIKQSQIFGYGGILIDSLDAEKYGSSPLESLAGPGLTLTTRTLGALASGKPKKIAKAVSKLVPELPFIPPQIQPRNIIKESMD